MSFLPPLQQLWFAPSLLPRRQRLTALLLFPGLYLCSLLFRLLVRLRRAAYGLGWAQAVRLPVPVVVVGNITVGGAGKTPLTVWLAQRLKAAGRRPGIVSRGYGGSISGVAAVAADADPARVGDEPLLLARASSVPIWVGRDRAAAAQALLTAHPECDLILCDDGLQHYRLARDVEIVVFDARGAGNGHLLPAGPLREPLSRLGAAQALVCNGLPDSAALRACQHLAVFDMKLVPGEFQALADPARRCTPADLAGRSLHAVAGIGDPRRFFRTLAELGLEFTPHPFPDHHAYRPEDLAFAEDAVLLLTEKDGVKCAAFPLGEAWVLPVAASVTPDLSAYVLEKLNGRTVAGHSGLPGVQG